MKGLVCSAAALLVIFAEKQASASFVAGKEAASVSSASTRRDVARRRGAAGGKPLRGPTALASAKRFDAQWWPMQELTEDRAMLVLVRHGQSEWNFENRFIGQYDSPLTEEGEWEAEEAGHLLKDHNIEVDEVHASFADRTVRTAQIATAVMREAGLDVPAAEELRTTWRLNERSYGALTGRNKKECAKEYGEDQLRTWRRSWDEPPPACEESSEFYRASQEAFREKVVSLSGRGMYDFASDPPPLALPRTESLQDTQRRILPYYEDVLLPKLRAGKRIVVFGHENNLRALIKHLDDLDDDAILDVDVPRAMPLVYVFERRELLGSRSSAPRLKPRTLTPPDAAAGAELLSSRYLVDQELVTALHNRDTRNVYDTSVLENLEEVCAVSEEGDMCDLIGEYQRLSLIHI